MTGHNYYSAVPEDREVGREGAGRNIGGRVFSLPISGIGCKGVGFPFTKAPLSTWTVTVTGYSPARETLLHHVRPETGRSLVTHTVHPSTHPIPLPPPQTHTLHIHSTHTHKYTLHTPTPTSSHTVPERERERRGAKTTDKTACILSYLHGPQQARCAHITHHTHTHTH